MRFNELVVAMYISDAYLESVIPTHQPQIIFQLTCLPPFPPATQCRYQNALISPEVTH